MFGAYRTTFSFGLSGSLRSGRPTCAPFRGLQTVAIAPVSKSGRVGLRSFSFFFFFFGGGGG